MSDDVFELFPNTGIQIVARLPRGLVKTPLANCGWQYAFRKENGQLTPLPWCQWQVLDNQCFLAVDTTTGDLREGYVRETAASAAELKVVDGLVNETGDSIPNFPSFSLKLMAAAGTAPRDVHLVVDFGNSRTGALLVESHDRVYQRLNMLPFELCNRFSLRHWREGEYQSEPTTRWFSSRTTWSESPYRPPQSNIVVEKVSVREGWRNVIREVGRPVTPNLFEDWSMARMGREADDILRFIQADVLLSVSSPKRFLWADDREWLDNRVWQKAMPYDNRPERLYYGQLSGRLLSFLNADDSDRILGVADKAAFEREPVQALATHVPRSLMVVALYELLAQVYSHVNSIPYRTKTGERNLPRRIATLTLSYPSGMVYEERQRFEKQARKAARIFAWTLGQHQGPEPEVHLTVDEATAAQLSYVWGELQMVGLDPHRLCQIMSCDHAADPLPPEESSPAETSAPDGHSMDNPLARDDAAGELSASDTYEDDEVEPRPVRHQSTNSWRIACIDIGGGTTDLMIANYTYKWGDGRVARTIEFETLHRDGVSRAGDFLIKLLLERLIVPEFTRVVGLSKHDAVYWFGEETPNNREYRLVRSQWVNRVFVPLAQEYLENAVIGDSQRVISHFFSDGSQLVDELALHSLTEHLNARAPDGQLYNLSAEMNLRYRPEEFEPLIWECFGKLLRDFCKRITEYKADVVLLAGQPTKLAAIQNMVRMFLPLSSSRIIPMHKHYAGGWYPYQDPSEPGVITDPKSAVVVGAALEMASKSMLLNQIKFAEKPRRIGKARRYYWGMLAPDQPVIHSRDVWFRAEDARKTVRVTMDYKHVVVGRKLYPEDDAEAAPVYLLQAVPPPGARLDAPVKVDIEIERKPNPEEPTEEILVLKSATGYVAGEEHPAVLDENIFLKTRTLGRETFFLDTGALDDIRFVEPRRQRSRT
jgi:hypothetical protein